MGQTKSYPLIAIELTTETTPRFTTLKEKYSEAITNTLSTDSTETGATTPSVKVRVRTSQVSEDNLTRSNGIQNVNRTHNEFSKFNKTQEEERHSELGTTLATEKYDLSNEGKLMTSENGKEIVTGYFDNNQQENITTVTPKNNDDSQVGNKVPHESSGFNKTNQQQKSDQTTTVFDHNFAGDGVTGPTLPTEKYDLPDQDNVPEEIYAFIHEDSKKVVTEIIDKEYGKRIMYGTKTTVLDYNFAGEGVNGLHLPTEKYDLSDDNNGPISTDSVTSKNSLESQEVTNAAYESTTVFDYNFAGDGVKGPTVELQEGSTVRNDFSEFNKTDEKDGADQSNSTTKRLISSTEKNDVSEHVNHIMVVTSDYFEDVYTGYTDNSQEGDDTTVTPMNLSNQFSLENLGDTGKNDILHDVDRSEEIWISIHSGEIVTEIIGKKRVVSSTSENIDDSMAFTAEPDEFPTTILPKNNEPGRDLRNEHDLSNLHNDTVKMEGVTAEKNVTERTGGNDDESNAKINQTIIPTISLPSLDEIMHLSPEMGVNSETIELVNNQAPFKANGSNITVGKSGLNPAYNMANGDKQSIETPEMENESLKFVTELLTQEQNTAVPVILLTDIGMSGLNLSAKAQNDVFSLLNHSSLDYDSLSPNSTFLMPKLEGLAADPAGIGTDNNEKPLMDDDKVIADGSGNNNSFVQTSTTESNIMVVPTKVRSNRRHKCRFDRENKKKRCGNKDKIEKPEYIAKRIFGQQTNFTIIINNKVSFNK